MSIHARLAELGIVLPSPKPPVANYVPVVVAGGFAYTSGQVPFAADGTYPTGHLGADVSLEEGIAAARQCAINILVQLNAAGLLDRVARVVKLGVFVASTPEFTDHPKVGNGASDLMADVFGEAGRHARSAVGVAALPLGVPVEVDAVVELKP
jgi:enamine deaminase RidA (YjgF/YER057c/UK114 family)